MIPVHATHPVTSNWNTDGSMCPALPSMESSLKWKTWCQLGVLLVLFSPNSWLSQSEGWINMTACFRQKNQRQAFQTALLVPLTYQLDPNTPQTSRASVSCALGTWGTLAPLSKWYFAGSSYAALHQLGSSPNTVRIALQGRFSPWPYIRTIWRALVNTSANAPTSRDAAFNQPGLEAWPRKHCRFPRWVYLAAKAGHCRPAGNVTLKESLSYSESGWLVSAWLSSLPEHSLLCKARIQGH